MINKRSTAIGIHMGYFSQRTAIFYNRKILLKHCKAFPNTQ